MKKEWGILVAVMSIAALSVLGIENRVANAASTGFYNDGYQKITDSGQPTSDLRNSADKTSDLERSRHRGGPVHRMSHRQHVRHSQFRHQRHHSLYRHHRRHYTGWVVDYEPTVNWEPITDDDED